MKKQVWIDTDLSVGMKSHEKAGFCDVDDGYAVLQLMKAKNILICGISAVFGNTIIENAFELSQKMSAEFTEYEIPVYKGAEGAIDLRNVKSNDAVDALAAALKERKMTILAIGPATNIGILLMKYPQLTSQIEEVILVAGRRKATDYFEIGNKGVRVQDLNFDLDNDAFRILFESGVSVVLCPFEISSKVWLKQADIDSLKNGNLASNWLAEKSQPWLNQWIDLGAEGFNPFDVLASHYIIAPNDILKEELKAHLEIHVDDTLMENDKEVYKNYLLCNKEEGYSVTYCYDVVPNYHEKLMASLNK